MLDACRLLLEAGADPCAPDEGGRTPARAATEGTAYADSPQDLVDTQRERMACMRLIEVRRACVHGHRWLRE